MYFSLRFVFVQESARKASVFLHQLVIACIAVRVTVVPAFGGGPAGPMGLQEGGEGWGPVCICSGSCPVPVVGPLCPLGLHMCPSRSQG